MKVDHFTDDRIAEVYAGNPLTPEERSYLIRDTPGFEECSKDLAAALPSMSDADLMRACYTVWADYVSTQL